MQLEDVVATATEDELAATRAVAKASAAGVPVMSFIREKPTRAPLSGDLPPRTGSPYPLQVRRQN